MLLRFDKFVDFLLHRTAANEFVHQNIFRLPDAEGAIGRLVLDRRIPPTVKVHHMRRGGKVQSCASRSQREHEKANRLILLELTHQLFAFPDVCPAMQNQTAPSEARSQERRERPGDFAKLRKYQHFLLFGCNGLGDFAQAGPLAAVFRTPLAVAQPL